MKQEKIDELMEKIDRRCKLPKHWDEFIKNNSKKHHLIIKYTKEKKLYCTNCNQYFYDDTVKVRDYIKCPHCNEESTVYGINYYRQEFVQSVILVQRIDKQVVIRVFEIYSYFKENSKKINTHFIEYARILPGIGRFIGNNVFFSMFGDMIVYHGYKKIYWRAYKGHRFFTDYPTYPYDKKRIIKGTNMEYAPINEFLERFSHYRYNFLDVLELAAYESFEILWNMKLYNLCFYSKALNKNGSFYKRFKVPKSFLSFMQEKNISYKELMLLRLFQKTDYKLIQKFIYSGINNVKYLIKNNIVDEFLDFGIELDKNTIYCLEQIKKYVPLKKFFNYNQALNNFIIYKDYLEMADKLALNYKKKEDLFPEDLIQRHDELQKQIKINNDVKHHFGIYLRYLELSKYTYEDDKHIIFPANTSEELEEEGRQQGNCVNYMYSQRYIDKETEIFFMRKIDDMNKSLVTVEFLNNSINQKEQKNHKKTTEEQDEFLEKWVMYRKFIDKKEKYNKKKDNVIIKYNLIENVA